MRRLFALPLLRALSLTACGQSPAGRPTLGGGVECELVRLVKVAP